MIPKENTFTEEQNIENLRIQWLSMVHNKKHDKVKETEYDLIYG